MFSNNKISNTHNKSKSIKVYDIKQFLIATIVTFTCFYCYYSVIETIKPSTLAATFQSYQHTNLNINLSPDISILTNIPKSSTTTTTTTTTASNNLFTSNHVCAGNNIAAYFNITEGSNNQMMMDLQWCQDTVRTHKVEIGRSWGSLGREGKTRWDQVNCNELLKLGKRQSCAQRWGWASVTDWLSTASPMTASSDKSYSRVSCAHDVKTSTFCRFQNVILDFSKVRYVGRSRAFDSEFFNVYAEEFTTPSIDMAIPGLQQHIMTRNQAIESNHCDVFESRPVFLLSNDDIYNLGHYSDDLISMWHMLALSGQDSRKSVLLNMDGFRQGGAAGLESHRLMEQSDPDRHGPYSAYYESWFADVWRARDYQDRKQRVCFSEIYLKPHPGVPWFWNDWGRMNECSQLAPSPLYQSFNLFLRQRWLDEYGSLSLSNPDNIDDEVHVVIELRAINAAKKNSHSSSRHIQNIKNLLEALRAIPGVRVTAQDFALLPFAQQVALSHSAGVFVSMHGAGTTHIMHMALGRDRCCALVELQPDHTQGFQDAHGYGNLARMFGLHYFRYEAADGATTKTGTNVDIKMVSDLIHKAVEAVRVKPSCLHDVKDISTSPILATNYFENSLK